MPWTGCSCPYVEVPARVPAPPMLAFAACLPGLGGNGCTACALGFYSEGGNSTAPRPACQACATGWMTETTGAQSSSQCTGENKTRVQRTHCWRRAPCLTADQWVLVGCFGAQTRVIAWEPFGNDPPRCALLCYCAAMCYCGSGTVDPLKPAPASVASQPAAHGSSSWHQGFHHFSVPPQTPNSQCVPRASAVMAAQPVQRAPSA